MLTVVQCIASAESLKIDKTRIILGGGSAGANLVSLHLSPNLSVALSLTIHGGASGCCSGKSFAR